MKLYQAGYYRLGGRASGSGWKIVAPSAGMSEIAKAGFKGIAAKLVDLKQSIQMPKRAMGIFRHDRFIYLVHVHYAASGDDSRGVAYVHGYCFSVADYFELLLQPELLFGAQPENFDLEYDPALSAYPAVEGLFCRNMNERWLLDKYRISSEMYRHLLLGSICALEGFGGPLCIKCTAAAGQEPEVYQDLMYLVMKGLPYHLRQKLLSFSWQGAQAMVFLSDTVQGDCYIDLDTEAFCYDDARLAAYQFTRLYEAELFYKNKDARERIFENIARFIQEVFTEPLKDAGCMQIEAAFQKLIKKNEDGIDAELSVGLLQDFLRAGLHYGQETAQYIAILLETINRNDLAVADPKLAAEIEQAFQTCVASVAEQMLLEQMALFYARRILAQKKDQAFLALLELKNTDAKQMYPLVCRCLEYLDLGFFTDYFWNQFLPGELTTLKKAELFLKSNGEGFSANEQFSFFKLLKNLIEDEMKRAGSFEELCVAAEAVDRILNGYPQIDKAGKLWDYTCFSLWNRFELEWFQTKSVSEYGQYEVQKLAEGYEQKSCPHAIKVQKLMEIYDQARLCTDAHQLWDLFFDTAAQEDQADRRMLLRGYREEFFDRIKNGRTGGTTVQDLDQSLVLFYDPEKKQFDLVRWMTQWAQVREIVFLTSLFMEYGKESELLSGEPYKAYAVQFLDEALKSRKHTAYSMLPESQQKALRILSDSLHGKKVRNPGTTQLFLYSLHREALGFFAGLTLAVCGVCFWRYGSGDIFIQMIFAVVAAISLVLLAGMKAMEGWSGAQKPDLGLKGMFRKGIYLCFPAALAATAGLLYDRGGFQEKVLGLMAFLAVAAAMALICGLTTKE